MITSIDTSVLLKIFKGETDSDTWLNELIKASTLGELVVCDIVIAEIGVFFKSRTTLEEQLNNLNIRYLETSVESAYYAAEIFRKYRKLGGPRDHLIPDFLIAAHASRQTNQIISLDRGYFRTYFKDLKVINLSKVK